jgi:hypothetical protein
VSVVVRKHALGAHDGMTKFAEIFYFFVLMFVAENFASVALSHLDLGNGLLALSTHRHACRTSLIDTVHFIEIDAGHSLS